MTFNLLEKILFIREFETLILNLFDTGKLNGTTHTCIGQEAIPVSALSFAKKNDFVISNHRGHGHYLAYGGCPELLLYEILGSEKGLCSGIGGSQHLKYENFLSNGILGGMQPIALGLALGIKIDKQESIVFSFLGDGALGEGVVYESLNIAALWKLPILFIVENNKYAQSTPINDNLSGSISKRFESFGIDTSELNTNDIDELVPHFEQVVSKVRSKQSPQCVVVNTYRLAAHSKGDDHRDKEEVSIWRNKDPIKLIRQKIGEDTFNEIEKKIKKNINSLEKKCLDDFHGKHDKKSIHTKNSKPNFEKDNILKIYSNEKKSGVLALNHTLDNLLNSNKHLQIIGEDIKDPYGGAFKVTKGFSTKFPKQIHSSPISEAAIVGLGSGLSIIGKVAIIEIMFGDFITLTIDQIINHVTKFPLMYEQKFLGKLIIRTPMGGYRGYGPTHSQTMEKILFGTYNLEIYAFDLIHNQKYVWNEMLKSNVPTVYVENKSLYSKKTYKIENNKSNNLVFKKLKTENLTTLISLKETNYYDVIIFCYGGMSEIAISAIERSFIENEISIGVVLFSKIYPIKNSDIEVITKLAKKIIFLDEAYGSYSWGSEIISCISESNKENFIIRRVNAKRGIIPSSKEKEMLELPNIDNLIKEIEAINEV